MESVLTAERGPIRSLHGPPRRSRGVDSSLRVGYHTDVTRSGSVKTAARAFAILLPSLATTLLHAGAPEYKNVPHGRIETINGYRVLSLDGTPEEMGTACGKLLGETIRKVVKALVTDGFGSDPEAYRNILAGSMTMEKFQPKEYLAELRALAAAANVPYQDLLMLQYFGDVRRAIVGPGSARMCTSFAILPPWTQGNTCIVGRNLDYFDEGVSEYAAILAYYHPTGKTPFVTVTWAGIINGWTLLNTKGIVVSNNTAFGSRSDSLEGISTCFLLRYVVENSASVEEGIKTVQRAPRTCGTNMLIASGNPPDAVILEFDHAAVKVRRPREGFVGAANGFLDLYRDETAPYYGRIEVAYNLVQKLKGSITIADNIAGAAGVPISSMNLHSAMIDATNLRLRIAMGGIPACKRAYRAFRLTAAGIASDEHPKSGN